MDKIKTVKQAEAAIQEVAQFLEDYREVLPEQYYCRGEDESAELARKLCTTLLSSSRANGLGGCRYCRG